MSKKIAIVGIDGSGKTTLIKKILSVDNQIKHSHWSFFKKALDKSYDNKQLNDGDFVASLSKFTRSSLFLYLIGLQLDKIIEPNNNSTILLDSYWYKFVAKMEVSMDGKSFLLDECLKLPKPNAIIFIDTEPKIAFDRKKEFNYYECNGSIDNFIQFQTDVRKKIISFLDKDIKIIKIDGKLSPNEIFEISHNFIKNL